VAKLEVLGEEIENSRRPVQILKAERAYACYREMVHYYAVKTLVTFLLDQKLAGLEALKQRLGQPRRGQWTNVGGQLMLRDDVEALREKVLSGELDSWDAVHAEYLRLWEKYPQDKARHALGALLDINGVSLDGLDHTAWFAFLDRAASTKDSMAEQTRASRGKDYSAPFRRMTFDSQAEMEAIVGSIEENDFVQQMRAEAEQFRREVETVKQREPA